MVSHSRSDVPNEDFVQEVVEDMEVEVCENSTFASLNLYDVQMTAFLLILSSIHFYFSSLTQLSRQSFSKYVIMRVLIKLNVTATLPNDWGNLLLHSYCFSPTLPFHY